MEWTIIDYTKGLARKKIPKEHIKYELHLIEKEKKKFRINESQCIIIVTNT